MITRSEINLDTLQTYISKSGVNQMSSSHEDPFVNMRRIFPLGPSFRNVAPQGSQGVVPFGIRYAVPSVAEAAQSNKPTKPKVSINSPTSPDGKEGQRPQTDDIITEGSD